jgi:hypothetical protein
MPEDKVDRTVLIIDSIFNDTEEIAYWHARTPGERLEHIERLRRINYGDKATGRLQRILEITRGI